MGCVGRWWSGHVQQINRGGLRVVRSVGWVVGGRVVHGSVGLVVGRRVVGPVGLVVSKYIKEQEYLKYCLFLEELILVIKLLK